ncbi:hypothetical protein CGCSCA4_v002866 [Colletotrichum siamense]|uniref:Uncharacterized protein n=1 Tax=Colletotrichum siamense TaxID=690259 RepID=A0A9P5KBE9_COLSI|nr:hypothetical protein CGCSCA4_v002866 [Colletotrichum siamense]KAF4867370.1 hypothetical protein CGCSCA2_v000652 [Colletotrichum siamense]
MCNLKGIVVIAVLAVTVTITAAAAIRPSIQQSVETVVDIVTATTTVQPPATTSIKCDHQWCQDGASMCVYWAGVTGFDPSRGPIPGETVTNLGPCAMPTATAAQDLLPRKVEANKMLITPAPTVTVDCSYKFCQDSTSYCMYWAGVTGWDVSLGAIPGMQRTSLGNCEAPTSTSVDESGNNNLPIQTATAKSFKARGVPSFQ